MQRNACCSETDPTALHVGISTSTAAELSTAPEVPPGEAPDPQYFAVLLTAVLLRTIFRTKGRETRRSNLRLLSARSCVQRVNDANGFGALKRRTSRARMHA